MTSRQSSSDVSSHGQYGLGDAGIVDQNVDFAKTFFHLGEQGRNRIWIAHVAGDRNDLRRSRLASWRIWRSAPQLSA